MKESSRTLHPTFTGIPIRYRLFPQRHVPMQPATLLRISKSHRAIGTLATIPVVGWILSSFVLHGVGLALPNGLQGVYELETHADRVPALTDSSLVAPGEVLARLAADGVDRIYWLRLEEVGDRPVYVVKPGPFELERVYDARDAVRLDPLPAEMLTAVADAHLQGTVGASHRPGDEFNRYYTVERVPALAFEMEGEQPSELVFSTASGRILRRTDPMAGWFHSAYLSVHVWQWGDSLRVFTTLLYGLVGLALLLVSLGYMLWWTRRERARRWTDAVRPARKIHRRFAPVAGFLLATQMLVGAYLWYNLGLIEPRFRGQGSFAEEWVGGIAVTESLADAASIAEAVASVAPSGLEGMQRFEWRAVGNERFWLAYPARNENGILVDAASGQVIPRLSPQQAAIAGASVVEGEPVGPADEATEYWMDYNTRVPTWRFRFSDVDETDVHISQITGEVVQRRPAVWRSFGPFLRYHTFGFTGNPWLDTVLLTTLQLSILTMVVTGWRMVLGGWSSSRPSSAS